MPGRAQEIAEAFVNALYLENMPLSRKLNGETYEYKMVSEYFEIDRLQ